MRDDIFYYATIKMLLKCNLYECFHHKRQVGGFADRKGPNMCGFLKLTASSLSG